MEKTPSKTNNEIDNEIFLKRKFKMNFIRSDESNNSMRTIATMMKNIESLGFTFSTNLISALVEADNFIEVFNYILRKLKRMVGATMNYKPMYPNFPKQLMEISDMELYMNAIMHYYGDAVGLRIIPKYEKEYRSPLLEVTQLTVIDYGTEDEYNEMFFQLIESNTSISETDMTDLKHYLSSMNTQDMEELLNLNISYKEILAVVSVSIIDKFTKAGETPIQISHVLAQLFNTVNDVLRLATALSDGDVSLAENTKYITFSRPVRRILLGTINELRRNEIRQAEKANVATTTSRVIDNLVEDMLRFKMKWLRLGEKLHPREYDRKYVLTALAFYKLRENIKIETFNSKVEKYLKNPITSFNKFMVLMQSRPGDFARRLDHILRNSELIQQSLVVNAFSGVSEKVSTRVLLQIMTHFEHRYILKNRDRIIMPKGSIAKLQVIPAPKDKFPILPTLMDTLVKLIKQTLLNRFKLLEPLGKTYVDPALVNYLVPFSQRSASKTLKTIVRGSRIPLENKSTVRFYVFWKDSKGQRIDVDLSAVFLKSDWTFHSQVSYTNLRNGSAYHSGDITSAPKGASEFIDINKNMALENGVRYVVMNVYSFLGQLYSDMDRVSAGWMNRDEVQSGEIFEPKTIQNNFDLNAESKIAIPLIIDLLNNDVIWMDMSLVNQRSFQISVEGNLSNVSKYARAIAEIPKTNLYELFYLHASARGEIVLDPVFANTIFGINKNIELTDVKQIIPTDIEKISSEFL